MSWNTTTVRRGANHPLHLILTVATCGLWALVWVPLAVVGRREVHTAQQTIPVQPVTQLPVWSAHQAQAPGWQWNPYSNRWEPKL